MRANLTYGIDGGLLDKPGEAWSLPYFNECLPARPVDDGTHCVPYPPYVDYGTA